MQKVTTQQKPQLMGVEDVACRLRVCTKSIQRLLRKELMPKELLIGGARRWDPEVIERWIAAGCPDRKTWEAIEKRREMVSLVPGAAEPRVVSETGADYFQAGFLL
jgi:hypothetical protein